MEAALLDLDDDLVPQPRSRSNTWPRVSAPPTTSPPPPPAPDSVAQAQAVDSWEAAATLAVITEDVVDAAGPSLLPPSAPHASSRAGAVPPPLPPRPRNPWGSESYADLIAQAIESSPEKRLTLAQIYRWLEQTKPYFRALSAASPSGGAGWKNSVRHNLSLLDRFVKIQNEDKGQSSWWMVNPDARPGRPRRRAASMEASKSREQSRNKALERARALREAKQAEAEAAACSADQLASSLDQRMALQHGAQGLAQGYPPQPGHADYPDKAAAPRSPFLPRRRARASPMSRAPPSPSPPQYQQLPTFLDSSSSATSELPTVLPVLAPLPYSSEPPPQPRYEYDYPARPAGRQPLAAAMADMYRPYVKEPARQGPSNAAAQHQHLASAPTLYQLLASDPMQQQHQQQQHRLAAQAQQCMRLPPSGTSPSACSTSSSVSSSPSSYYAVSAASPCTYQAASEPSAYQSLGHDSPPDYEYQHLGGYSESQCQYQPLGDAPSAPYSVAVEQPYPASRPSADLAVCDELGLNVSVESGLNCDVDAIVKQELILEGNLDFNFNQSAPQSLQRLQRQAYNPFLVS